MSTENGFSTSTLTDQSSLDHLSSRNLLQDLATPISSSLSSCSMVCRICQTFSKQELLISPCNCKGSLAYVHLSCLEKWLNQAGRTYCEICMYQFNSTRTPRYGFWESIRLWFRHPINRHHCRSTAIITVLLTTVTVGLVVMCLFGMQYFVIEARKMGVSELWTKSFVMALLGVVLLGYGTTFYVIVKDEVVPWHRWWSNTVDVKLLLTPSIIDFHEILE
nr:E3 ubiquitin-protein ligase MARCH3-like [Onthophagus taurus]